MSEVLDELDMEISMMDSCSEREELERTRTCCRELSYALEEGFIQAEAGEDGELRFFPA